MMEMEKERPAGMSRSRYCKCLKLNRSTLYYKPKVESSENLEIMRMMDQYSMVHPTAGVLTMVNMLALAGMVVNPKRVHRLLRKMGILAVYPKKCLSKGGKPVYRQPYLLRDLEITHANQVWSIDISYIPMKDGFMYLYAIIDVYSRFIVGWRLSNTLSATNCHELLRECVERYGSPEIINSDQGSQFTTQAWLSLLDGFGIKVSMDGRGRCKDNIWIERFWRTIKQEHIYINPAESVDELRQGINDFMHYYNYQRPHQAIEELLPCMRYGVAA